MTAPTQERFQDIKFERFCPDIEEWEYYFQRFEMELTIHNLNTPENENQRRNLLLSKVGPEPFRMLVDHFKPDNVSTKTYAEVKEVLNKYYGKPTYVLSERVAFTLYFRSEGETVTKFLSNLRGLATRCEFGDNLRERIRDQLVTGINNHTWQQELIRLHPTNNATLEEVEASALILEQAATQANKLSQLSNPHYNVKQTNRVFDKYKQAKSAQKNMIKTLNPEKHCLFCGGDRHKIRNSCPAKGKTCSSCGEDNHFARACITSGNVKIIEKKRKTAHHIRKVQEQESGSDDVYESDSDNTSANSSNTSAIFNVKNGKKIFLDVVINGRKMEMLYDPGAAYSVISERLWKKVGSPKLAATENLVAYTGVEVPTLGISEVNVRAFNTEKVLKIHVVKDEDLPLFGLDWCLKFNLPLPTGARLCKINKLTMSDQKHDINKLLAKYKELFNGEIGSIKGHFVKIHIDQNVTPKVFRPRPVPIALQDQVSSELDRLIREDVLEAVQPTDTQIEWATPVVIALKSNGSVRICGDFRVTINPHVQKDDYPLPRYEDIMSKLSGGTIFSKIDLKDAYLQLLVHPDYRKFLVIVTHKGYYRYKRLPFGISFAPSLFQRTMDQILSGIDGVVCFLDDILIMGSTIDEHNQRLGYVLERLKNAGIRTQEAKCKWLQNEIIFLGHKIDKHGLHPTTELIEAIVKMPAPKNVAELRSFLGSITYYGRFIKNLHVLCVPLYDLLKKGNKWFWSDEENKIFNKLKTVLTSTDTLAHYNPSLPLLLTSDASEAGAGAVLFHKYPDGNLRPIAYASRRFNKTESRYSTIDKEALALVYAVTKFHQYVYGRHFTLVTDHRPLERIFSEKRETPKIASNRLLRWAMLLNSYDYTIQYQSGKENSPADALSRLPIAEKTDENLEPVNLGLPARGQLLHLRTHNLPISKKLLIRETEKDELFRKIIYFINNYWPDKDKIPQELHSFYEKKNELSFEEHILLWKGRICIPISLRAEVLKMLHDGHPGINAMQSMAKLHVFWPNINEDICNFSKSCTSCQESRQNEQNVPLFPWSAPPEPWSRIHVDFAGPFEDSMWLIIIDAYTRWIEVLKMKSTTATETVSKLTETFSRFGIPKIIVSDNGPQLTSTIFADFCNSNGITHVKVTPYHPKSNGIAERAVKTFKERMRASRDGSKSQSERLYNFLFAHRNTVQRSTGRSPASLMFGRNIRSKFDQLKPDLLRHEELNKIKQKLYYDQGTRENRFEKGQAVWVNNPLGKGSKTGRIIKQNAPYSFVVEIDGVERRKHSDQMRPRAEEINLDSTENKSEAQELDQRQHRAESIILNGNENNFEEQESINNSVVPEPRRNPPRERKLPARYKDFILGGKEM